MHSTSEDSSVVLVTNTNNIVWQVDGERTLTICSQFNSNPETGSNIASVIAFQSDMDNVPIPDGIVMQMDYDLQSDCFTRFRSTGCDCLRNRLEKILSQQRISMVDWLHKAQANAQRNLIQSVFDPDLCDGSMLDYHDLIPGDTTGDSGPTFTSGTILIHNGGRWWVSDIYCTNPKCNCCDTLLVFYFLDDNRSSTKEEAVSIDYKMQKLYSIRRIDKNQVTLGAAHRLVEDWFENKPIWFTDDEIKSRSRQLKQVMARTMQQRVVPGVSSERRAVKAGRNDPCPCGSGRKYKKCCGK